MRNQKATEFTLDIVADLHKWQAFVAIGELGSLTRAALFLDSNQSLLSRQVNALERECHARLFTRTGRGVELSEVGGRLFPQVKELLSAAEKVELEVRGEAREPIGRVTLGLLPSVALLLVGRLFTDIRSAYPAISLRVLEGSSGQIEEWLSDARVDIAVFYRYGAALPEMEQSLAVVETYLIGAPGDKITAQPQVAFRKLDGLPFVLPGAPNGLRISLEAIARQHQVTVAPAIEVDSLPMQKSMAASEGLYTVLPLHAVWSEVSEGRLQAARIVDPSLQRTVSMAMSKSKGPARAVTAVAARIVHIADGLAHTGMWTRTIPE